MKKSFRSASAQIAYLIFAALGLSSQASFAHSETVVATGSTAFENMKKLFPEGSVNGLDCTTHVQYSNGGNTITVSIERVSGGSEFASNRTECTLNNASGLDQVSFKSDGHENETSGPHVQTRFQSNDSWHNPANDPMKAEGVSFPATNQADNVPCFIGGSSQSTEIADNVDPSLDVCTH